MLRILSATALVALVVAGCGSGTPERGPRGLPHELAQAWATRASAIASAAAARQDCRALQLASSLRDQIVADENRVPARLRRPLVQSANALAQRITCTPVTTPATTPAPPKKAPKPPEHLPGKKKHDNHGHGGDNGDQG
jgi:cell division septation protein DedD